MFFVKRLVLAAVLGLGPQGKEMLKPLTEDSEHLVRDLFRRSGSADLVNISFRVKGDQFTRILVVQLESFAYSRRIVVCTLNDFGTVTIAH